MERYKDLASFIEKLQPSPLLRDTKHLEHLSVSFGIPEEDILLIALNASGIRYGTINDRGRFPLTLPSGRSYFFALTLTNHPLSPFLYQEGNILLDEEIVISAGPIEKDTCTDSYWRGGKKHLTLNSNSRSKCRGCAFCGTYSLEDLDKALHTPDALRRKASALCTELGRDLSAIESIGVVTGCFPEEQSLLHHLLTIRHVFAEFGFRGELRYIGSQLRTDEALQKLIDLGPFALYLTVEIFERREQFMKRTKASLDLDPGRKLLQRARDFGAETSFLYIAGLDSLRAIKREFPKYQGVLTRLPLVQIFQAYSPSQLLLRNNAATSLNYFLQTRQIIEAALPTLHPQAWSNYRSLWYTTFAGKHLPNEVL